MKKSVKKIMTVVVAAAFSLPAMAQQFGAQEPSVQFQSTSTLTGSGSAYSSAPVIGSDGTSSYNDGSSSSATPPRNPRMAPPIQGGDDMPVGDAAIPLMLFALAYAACVVVRRRKEVTTK